MSTQLPSSRIGCHIAGECVNHIAHADDMVLLVPSIKALPTLIGICFKSAGQNEILYNETKTQYLAFWPQSYTQCVLPSMEFVVQVVNLGHILSSNLKDDSDIYKQVKKLKKIGNVLTRNFASFSENVKCDLFRAHCAVLNCSSLCC